MFELHQVKAYQTSSALPGQTGRALLFLDSFFPLLEINRQRCPPLPEEVRRILGLTLAGKDAFFVAVHPQDALGGLEIGKIPHQLTLHEVIVVEHGVGHLQIFILVLGTPHHAGELVRTAQVVGAVLSEDERAAMQDFCPAVHLMVEGGFGICQPAPPSTYQP